MRYRVDGPGRRRTGHRFNRGQARCIDPVRAARSAAACGGTIRSSASSLDDALTRDDRRHAPPGRRSARSSTALSPGATTIRPRTPWQDTVIYELHVPGFTRRHPGVPDDLRGTYLGLASEPALDHLKSLGVTAVELLPVHVHVDEQHLLEQGLSNYWGYNTLGFFAPDPRYAVSRTPLDTVREFKTMVRGLHAAGIEVILDVVYNHTAEGSHLGPQLSLRGIDNAVYYRLQPGNLRALRGLHRRAATR